MPREHGCRGILDFVLAREVVVLLQVHSQVCVVTVAPLRCLCVPRQPARHEVKAAEKVVPDVALQPRVVLKHRYNVGRGRLDIALAVIVERSHPGFVLIALGHLDAAEVVLRALAPLLCQQHAHAAVGRRPLLHQGVARQSCYVGRPAALVTHSEEVDAAQVKGVAKLPARGVGLVVAVGPFARVAHKAARHAALAVGVAALVGRRLVDVGQQCLDGLLDGVRAAESADDARLLGWVAGTFGLVGHRVGLARGRRPRRCVTPVAVSCQHRIDVACRAVLLPEHPLAVAAGARPVHQTRQLVGRHVKHPHPQRVGYPAAQRLVFLRHRRPAEREHQPVARSLRRVLVCRVKQSRKIILLREIVPHVGRGAVDVQCGHAAPHHTPVLAAAAVQEAAHKATHVFHLRLLLAAHACILRGALSRAGGLRAPLRELAPAPFPVAPFLRHAAVRRGDVDFKVMRHKPSSMSA